MSSGINLKVKALELPIFHNISADNRVSPTLAGFAALITVVNVYNSNRPKNSSTDSHWKDVSL